MKPREYLVGTSSRDGIVWTLLEAYDARDAADQARVACRRQTYRPHGSYRDEPVRVCGVRPAFHKFEEAVTFPPFDPPRCALCQNRQDHRLHQAHAEPEKTE